VTTTLSCFSVMPMIRHVFGILTALLPLAAAAAPGQPGAQALTPRPWFEARTAHFHLYSCGPTQEVARLAMRLEQFRNAYSILAGAQAVASPPIVVMAFPDRASMQPFLPLYQGRPANLTAFFSRGSDQNLIALPLSGSETGALKAVFHEYTHLLLRHNQPYWPMWLTEGMAEIYATFETSGGHTPASASRLITTCNCWRRTTHAAGEALRRGSRLARIQRTRAPGHLLLGILAPDALLDARRQPRAQSQLPAPDPPAPPGAIARTSLHQRPPHHLPAMEAELRGYLTRGKFAPLELPVGASLQTPRPTSRARLRRPRCAIAWAPDSCRSAASKTPETYFLQARKLAPAAPALRGSGPARRQTRTVQGAVRYLRQAMDLGPVNFLAITPTPGRNICSPPTVRRCARSKRRRQRRSALPSRSRSR